MRELHDHVITGTDYDFENRALTWRTECPSGALVNVIFRGVSGVTFIHGGLYTVIFSIEEVPMTDLPGDWEEEFREGYNYGWPMDGWRDGRAFYLGSSCGMSGLVLANTIEFVDVTPGCSE